MLYTTILIIIMCLCILSAPHTLLENNNLALKIFAGWLGKSMNDIDNFRRMYALIGVSPDLGILL